MQIPIKVNPQKQQVAPKPSASTTNVYLDESARNFDNYFQIRELSNEELGICEPDEKIKTPHSISPI